MKILTLEAYYGGSHQAFLDGWQEHSEHVFSLLTLPPGKWKWRMRHAAITFAQQVNELVRQGQQWDVLFCSDMLNLAEFLGLVDESIRQLPKVVYFHENQLTYPVQVESERDYQYCMTNITTAVAADAVWFNSEFHQNEFIEAIGAFLKRMPDYQPMEVVEQIRQKSSVHPPGIAPCNVRVKRAPGPVRILWAARWEHDKNPEDFFATMKILKEKGLDFRLNVIGEQFRDQPDVFNWAKEYFADHIDRWGYQATREEYETALAESDIAVSTANHEFYGISALEAITAGCFPLLPNRLSYPSIIQNLYGQENQQHFLYDGTVQGLANKLEELFSHKLCGEEPIDSNDHYAWLSALIKSPMGQALKSQQIQHYFWPQRAKDMDERISENLC